MTTTVTLTQFELWLAATVGMRRQVEALRKGLPEQHGHTGSGWNEHIEGACGELVVAKALDRYWNGSVNTFRAGGDVGAIQVRTRSRAEYELIVRPNDDDAAVFVLVTGAAPRYTIHGWIRGADAKRPAWRRAYGGRPPAFFVPHASLHALNHLCAPAATLIAE